VNGATLHLRLKKNVSPMKIHVEEIRALVPVKHASTVTVKSKTPEQFAIYARLDYFHQTVIVKSVQSTVQNGHEIKMNIGPYTIPDFSAEPTFLIFNFQLTFNDYDL